MRCKVKTDICVAHVPLVFADPGFPPRVDVKAPMPERTRTERKRVVESRRCRRERLPKGVSVLLSFFFCCLLALVFAGRVRTRFCYG